MGGIVRDLLALQGDGDRFGNSPHEAYQLTRSGHGHGDLDATQGLQGFNPRVEAPGCDPLVEFLVETLEAFGMFRHGTDIFLKDDLLRRGRPDDLREPSEMGRVPGGLASVAAIVSQQEGFETALGVFQIAAGIFPRPREIAHGFIFDRGDIDEGGDPPSAPPGPIARRLCDPF